MEDHAEDEHTCEAKDEGKDDAHERCPHHAPESLVEVGAAKEDSVNEPDNAIRHAKEMQSKEPESPEKYLLAHSRAERNAQEPHAFLQCAGNEIPDVTNNGYLGIASTVFEACEDYRKDEKRAEHERTHSRNHCIGTMSESRSREERTPNCPIRESCHDELSENGCAVHAEKRLPVSTAESLLHPWIPVRTKGGPTQEESKHCQCTHAHVHLLSSFSIHPCRHRTLVR